MFQCINLKNLYGNNGSNVSRIVELLGEVFL
jgi:hypothetical protein